MIRLLFILSILVIQDKDFRNQQKSFPRVKTAYASSHSDADKLFASSGLTLSNSEIFLRAHKLEKELELWARKKGSKTFALIKTYKVCALSGIPGPKRRQGDLQVPEGFYFIDRFNPSSSYHLSLGINYPNSCDRFHCASKPGGDIFIHGKCVTIGCLPLTDEKIEELYVIAVEAKAAGQNKIPVAIFPCRMDSGKMGELLSNASYKEHYTFWQNLKTGYDLFNSRKEIPAYTMVNGIYKY